MTDLTLLDQIEDTPDCENGLKVNFNNFSKQIVHYTTSFWILGYSLHVKCKLFDFISDAKNADEWMYAKNNFEKLWSGRIFLKQM